MRDKKRIALKYCGGCDSTYDRVLYWKKIREAGEGKIEWVTLDAPPLDGILLINGCSRACRERSLEYFPNCRIVSVRNNDIDPKRIIDNLLERWGVS